MGNYYESLGIRPDASVEEIDKAYRNLAVKLHPDKNPGDREAATRRFQQLQQIYETLIDAERRFFFNAAHCRLKGDWFLVPMNLPFRQMQFNADGSFRLEGKDFGAEDTVFGKVAFDDNSPSGTVTRAAGAGEELIFSGPGLMERYRFQNQRWYCWLPPRPAADPKTPQPKRETSTSRAISIIDCSTNDASTSPSAHRPPKTSGRFPRFVGRIVVGTALLLALIGGWMLKGLQHQGDNPNTQALLTPAGMEERRRAAKLEAEQWEIEEQERQQRERELAADTRRKLDAARNRDRLSALARRAEELLKLQVELVAVNKEWQSISIALRTNDEGRTIAARPEHVRTFVVETEKPRPSENAVAAIRIELEKLLAPLREAAEQESPAFNPSQDIDVVLDSKKRELEGHISEYQKSLSLMKALVASGDPIAPVTLNEAIASLAKEEDLKRAEQISRATADTRRKLDELAAAKAKRETEDRLARQRHLADLEAGDRADQLEHDRLVQEAKSRKVRAALGYFFAKDYIQPAAEPGTGIILKIQTAESQPISLSHLERMGVLNPDANGLRLLHALLINRHDQSRPTWGLPPRFDDLASADMGRLKQTQDYLIRLGPTLVELELLSE